MNNNLKTTLLIAIIAALLVTVLSSLASADSGNKGGSLASVKWQDVTAQLDCSYRGADGHCYFGPNDEAVTRFIEAEKRLKKSTEYLWQYNHGRPKSELDANSYYMSMKTNEGR